MSISNNALLNKYVSTSRPELSIDYQNVAITDCKPDITGLTFNGSTIKTPPMRLRFSNCKFRATKFITETGELWFDNCDLYYCAFSEPEKLVFMQSHVANTTINLQATAKLFVTSSHIDCCQIKGSDGNTTTVRIDKSLTIGSSFTNLRVICGASSSMLSCKFAGTNLDPDNKPQQDLLKIRPCPDGYVYGYRTSRNLCGSEYKVGQFYSSPLFDTGPDACRPGLYFFEKPEEARDFGLCHGITYSGIVKVRTKLDVVHAPKPLHPGETQKYRCRWFEVIKKV